VPNTAYKIAAANISFGGAEYASACDGSAYKTAIDILRSDGIATVASAGNSGSAALTVPACVSTAISVGATDNSDNVASYSNRVPFMSLFAPGDMVASSVPGSGYAIYSGTSMAAAQVSGGVGVVERTAPYGIRWRCAE